MNANQEQIKLGFVEEHRAIKRYLVCTEDKLKRISKTLELPTLTIIHGEIKNGLRFSEFFDNIFLRHVPGVRDFENELCVSSSNELAQFLKGF